MTDTADELPVELGALRQRLATFLAGEVRACVQEESLLRRANQVIE